VGVRALGVFFFVPLIENRLHFCKLLFGIEHGFPVSFLQEPCLNRRQSRVAFIEGSCEAVINNCGFSFLFFPSLFPFKTTRRKASYLNLSYALVTKSLAQNTRRKAS
jgi:hypothetical protein